MKPKVFKYNTFIERGVEYVQENCPYRQTLYKHDMSSIIGLGSYKCEKCPYCIERDTQEQIVKCDFRVLDLSLTYHWYDEIESNRKAIEYRELNSYWKKRLLSCYIDCIFHHNCRYYCIEPIHYDAVRFHRGQGGKQTMMYEFAKIHIGKGHVRWGALPDKDMFIIYLGKRLQ